MCETQLEGNIGDGMGGVAQQLLSDHESSQYTQWRFERLFLLGPAQAYVAQYLSTFEGYPPRQKPGSFTIDGVLETLQEGGTGSN